MSIPKISIIIPIYKAEEYLKRCVGSILKQTFEDWELLLIDDGSPDNSGVLCDYYANNDSRIRVFHKKNGGVASAREMGMQNARGEYSIHVDPDDWIEPDTLQVLYDKAKESDADLILCDFLLEYKGRQEIDRQEPKSLEPSSCFRQLIAQELHGSLCNKLIHTELYRKYNLHFPKGMNCWEDLYICCSIMTHDVRVAYVPKAFYHYDFFTNDNSMVRHTTLQGLQAQITCVRLLQDKVQVCYMEQLNEMKGLVLLTAFRLRLLQENEIRNLYPEINEWYINKYKKKWGRTSYYGLSLILDGKSYNKAKLYMMFTNLLLRIKKILINEN